MGSGASASSKNASFRDTNVARIASRDALNGQDNSVARVGSPDSERTFVHKYKQHTYRGYRFERTEEVPNDFLLARASWYRMNTQALGEDTFNATWKSAFLECAFFSRLLSTYPDSNLLKAVFKRMFLDDVMSILMEGVVFAKVQTFHNQYWSISIREYGQVGETLIETLLEVLPPSNLPSNTSNLTETSDLSYRLTSETDLTAVSGRECKNSMTHYTH